MRFLVSKMPNYMVTKVTVYVCIWTYGEKKLVCILALFALHKDSQKKNRKQKTFALILKRKKKSRKIWK